MLELEPIPIVAPDAKLLELGDAFDALAARLQEHIGAENEDEVEATYAQIEAIERDICETRATTLAGLRVKARVTKWWTIGDEVLLVHNDVDRTSEIAFAESILRDLLVA